MYVVYGTIINFVTVRSYNKGFTRDTLKIAFSSGVEITIPPAGIQAFNNYKKELYDKNLRLADVMTSMKLTNSKPFAVFKQITERADHERKPHNQN